MEYSTVGRHQDISAEGVIFDKGSVYDRLHKITDLRKARGKRHSLVTVLMITLLAKLCGANTPTEIAEWGRESQGRNRKLLKLKGQSMPEQSTYRRILAYKVYMEEVERLVGEYNQQGQHGQNLGYGWFGNSDSQQSSAPNRRHPSRLPFTSHSPRRDAG